VIAADAGIRALVQFNYAGNDLIPNKKKLFKKFYFCIAMPTP